MIPVTLNSAPARTGARVAVAVGTLVAAVVAGVGWLYALRGLNWFALGPHVRDSLPLLQLAGFDAQPLLRLMAAWIPAGFVAGLALSGVPRAWRLAIGGAVGVALLLVASQASFALARNLRFSDVLWSRHPGAGPWIEGVLFAVGCTFAGRLSFAWRPNLGRYVALLGQLRVRRREHGDARQH
jgi:hypothetical protein